MTFLLRNRQGCPLLDDHFQTSIELQYIPKRQTDDVIVDNYIVCLLTGQEIHKVILHTHISIINTTTTMHRVAPSIILIPSLLITLHLAGQGGGVRTGIYANYTGDILLGSLFPVHSFDEDNLRCGRIQEQDGVQALEAMLFTLDKINAQPDFLPGFRLGTVGLDSCDNEKWALNKTVEFVKALVNRVTVDHYICPDGSRPSLAPSAPDFHKVTALCDV